MKQPQKTNTFNQLIGLANLLMGLIQIILPATQAFFVIPKLSHFHQQFASQTRFTATYLILFLIFTAGLANLYFSSKLVFKRTISKNVLEKAVILLVISFITLGIFTGFTILSVINPIYNLAPK